MWTNEKVSAGRATSNADSNLHNNTLCLRNFLRSTSMLGPILPPSIFAQPSSYSWDRMSSGHQHINCTTGVNNASSTPASAFRIAKSSLAVHLGAVSGHSNSSSCSSAGRGQHIPPRGGYPRLILFCASPRRSPDHARAWHAQLAQRP